MSGLRLTKARAAGTAPAPKTREIQADRARQHMEVRYASATTEADRLSIAADYIRAVSRSVGPHDVTYADQLVREAAEQLVRVGHQINELRRRR